MQNRRNYYRILHVQPDAPAEIIRMSYRTLMQRLKMHPDLGGEHPQAVLINEAFATLCDPEKRAIYDRSMGDWLKRRSGARTDASQPRRDSGTAREPSAAPHSAASGSGRPASGPSAQAKASPVLTCVFCDAVHSASDASQAAAVCWRCDSPICPAVKQQGVSSGRLLDRLPRHLAVDIRLAGPTPHTFVSRTDDISISGARFVSALKLEPGQRLKIECAFCIAVGIVRHTQAEPAAKQPQWRVGVEFLTLLIKRPRGTFVSTQA